MGETIEITNDDRDLIRLTGSRLPRRLRIDPRELLTLALMSSENRAALALGRTYPGGSAAFVKAMNRKAKALGMHQSRFVDAAGLDAGNVASPHDLGRMVFCSDERYPAIRDATTRASMDVRPLKSVAHCISSTPTACCATTIGNPDQQDRLYQQKPAAVW